MLGILTLEVGGKGSANERTITLPIPIDQFQDLAEFGIHLGVKCIFTPPCPAEEEGEEGEDVEEIKYSRFMYGVRSRLTT